MTPEVRISLVVQGQAITEDDLAWLGAMGASKCWLGGEQRVGTQLTYAHSGCSFSPDSQNSYHLEEVVMCFLRQLVSERPELFDFIREHRLSPLLSACVYASDVIPSISLDARDVQLLAEHGIALDIDVILTAK